jgi:pimeloyl-ACP methyl ester carboxylesterase
MNELSNQLTEYITDNKIDKPAVFGFSMGGYVALNALTKTPNLLSKVITLGTKFNWTPEFSSMEIKNLNPEKIQEKVPQFGKYLDRLHGENWKSVMSYTANMMMDLGKQPLLTDLNLPNIPSEVIIMRGENDHMTEELESKQTAERLLNGSFYQLDDQPHMIEQLDLETLSAFIQKNI